MAFGCQCPKRAFLISTSYEKLTLEEEAGCQCPKRAFLISTISEFPKKRAKLLGVNALSGLFSFLQYPLEPLVNTGFPASFLQVFVRLF